MPRCTYRGTVEADPRIEEDLADGAEIAREARTGIEAGEPLIPWEQVKAEADL